MELFLEKILIYGLVLGFCLVVVIYYLWVQKKRTRKTETKITEAKAAGLHEPVSLHPVIDLDTCIGSAACIAACPEKDILGLVNGRATLVNASRCVGHGACFHACPVQAISLCIGTEKRGVELPHVNQNFETNVPGIYIAGELGGMGLIKNSVEQGRQAMEEIAKTIPAQHSADYDVIVVGAGPAGISGALTAKKKNLKFLVLEQDTLGGTVYTFPRSKVVMTAPMDLPLHGKVKLHETSKKQLLGLWNTVLSNNNVEITENTKVEAIEAGDDCFLLHTQRSETYSAARVLLAIGRRGSPRKLDVPGEDSEKVAYRLIEPELVNGKNVIVVGGGDSAIEAALSLIENNNVTLSYRKDAFSRIKPKNHDKIHAAIESGSIQMLFNSSIKSIHDDHVIIETEQDDAMRLDNDLVYIFAGGVLPIQFLEKAGIQITKRFGYALKKHAR